MGMRRVSPPVRAGPHRSKDCPFTSPRLTLSYPRPLGRGLIEAEHPAAMPFTLANYPRPLGRGLIEA